MAANHSLNSVIGLVLARGVVPAWVAIGALVKLYSGSPGNLPTNFVSFGRNAGIDLGEMLYTLIGLEFLAVGVMLLLARWARPMAIFMLASFCLILLGEMYVRADSCGCFGGTITIKPWQMLLVDGALLAGVLFFIPRVPESAWGLAKALPAMAVMGVLGIGLSFGAASVIHQDIEHEPNDDPLVDPDDPTRNPNPRSLPSNWWAQTIDDWDGKPWREIPLFQFMPRWPEGLDEGTHYIVFYSRTCSHCEIMFIDDFTRDIGAPVIAIEIPESRSQLRGERAWSMPETVNLTSMQLPLGPDWYIQAPLAMRIEDGIVRCAKEGDHVECFDLYD